MISSHLEHPRVRVGLTILAIAPIVVAVLRAITGDWYPVGDDGLLALRVDDVASSHHPWLGSWTSASLTLGEDVNNPGAWYAYLAAPPVAILGPATGTAVAVGLLNALAIVGTARAARVIGGIRAELWFLAGAAALGWAMGSELLIDLWQPHALLFPMLFLLTLAVGVALGRAAFLPWMLVTASVIVQTHLGHVYAITFVVGAALVLGGIARRDTLRQGPRRIVGSTAIRWSAAGVLLAWLPSLIEQFRYGSDGNLARLLRNVGGGDLTLGLGNAVGVFAEILLAPWSRARFDDVLVGAGRTPGPDPAVEVPGLPPLWLSVAVIGLFLAGLVALWRCARRAGRAGLARTLALATVAIPLAVLALSIMTVGQFLGAHHVRWSFAVALFCQIALAWGAVEWLRSVRPGLDLAGGVAAVIVVVASVANLWPYAQDLGPVGDRWARPTLREVEEQLDALEVDGPVFYDLDALRVFEPWSGPVMMMLGERDIEFHVTEEPWEAQVGRSRALDGSEIGRLYQLERSAVLFPDGQDCVLVVATGADDDGDAEILAVAEALAEQIRAGTIDPNLSRLPEAETSALTDAFARDDVRSLVRLVLEGALGRWIAAGAIEADPELVADDLRIGEWMRTVYGLFLETDAACPETEDG